MAVLKFQTGARIRVGGQGMGDEGGGIRHPQSPSGYVTGYKKSMSIDRNTGLIFSCPNLCDKQLAGFSTGVQAWC